MPLFRCHVERRSPLAIQLTAGPGGATVLGWDALGEDETGQTTRPVLYRPSTPGIGRASEETAVVVCLDRDGRVASTAEIITVFSIFPSLPEGSQRSGFLPYLSSARGRDVWVPPGETVVLYAATDFEGSIADTAEAPIVHVWSGSLEWTE